MEITRKDLINYHLIEQMIEKNKKKLERYKRNEPCVSIGKVYGSSKNFPYTQCSFTVGGSDQGEFQRWKEWDKKCRYLELSIDVDTRKMIDLKLAIDELICGIDDVSDKAIFEYTVEGKSQNWIADKLHMDQSNVSLRIKKYLKS